MIEPINGTGTRARTISLIIVACVLGAAALYFGAEVFLPITFAALLNAALRPLVRMLMRVRVPAPLAAGIVVLGLTAALILGGWALSVPLQEWVRNAPSWLNSAQGRLDKIRRPVQKATDVANRIQQVTQGSAGSTGAPGATTTPTTSPSTQPSTPPQPQAPPAPPWLASAFGTTTSLLGAIVEILLLLYLLLAADDLFLHKLVKVIPYARDKAKAVRAVDEVQTVVLRYLLVTLMINLGQGVVVFLVMWWLRLPSPLLWGLFTVVFEFIPYLGATIMVAMLAITGFATFDGWWHALAPPLAYLVITTIQNNVVSPYAYGNRLKLNPVAVLVGVLIWWFLWGIAGAFLAVPIVATIKIVADRVEGMKPVGEFLGE